MEQVHNLVLVLPQAMEMMKASSSSANPRETGYESYFDAFVDGKDNYTTKEDEEDEGAVKEGLPYILFLLSPIVFIFFLAARKTFRF